MFRMIIADVAVFENLNAIINEDIIGLTSLICGLQY